MRTFLSRSAAAVALGALAFAGACKEATSVPDLNNLPSSTIAGGFTPTTFQLLLTGLVNQDRANFGFRYLVFEETQARDVYVLDPSENRFITELLGNQIDPGGFSGAGNFLGFYEAVNTANALINGAATVGTFAAADQAAAKGFAQTIKALQLYRVFTSRGPNGLVADAVAPGAPLPPVLCQQDGLARISALLDTAITNLKAGGATFPFTLPPGFSSNGTFNTPATFVKVAYGLKGRAEVYRGILGRAQSYTDAIAALNASFLDATGNFSNGVYYTYSTAANEQVNPLAAVTIYLNPLVGTRIAAGDLRSSKITTVAKRTLNGVSSTFKSPLASTSNLTGSIPWLRNAELVLLRAQAEIGAGQLAAATADINAVRTAEGGLPAYSTFTSAAQAIGAALYEKQYSLLLTGAQRIVDLRSYGYLNANGYTVPPGSYMNLTPANQYTFPQEQGALDLYLSAFPLPKAELDARGGASKVTLTCSSS